MLLVSITAFGVGMATAIGAIIGFGLKNVTERLNAAILGFAAGVMLAASVLGLIIPALDAGGKFAYITVAIGILAGAFSLSIVDKIMPHLHNLAGIDQETHSVETANIDRLLLFVFAIGIHNFPEGMAAGVGFGTGDIGNAFVVAGGIALQNIPEGMVIIAPLLQAGLSKKRTLGIALATSLVEVVGTFFGYFAATVSSFILPFALAFAGGTMLYVVSDEMIPETHSHGYEKSATFALLIGFIIIMVMDFLL